MSLYNIINGSRSEDVEDRLWRWAGIEDLSIPRYRDTWMRTKYPVVCVLTRTGGGNREEYASENDDMTLPDTYIYDKDADFDSTYAEFYYRVKPEFIDEWKNEVKQVLESDPNHTSDSEDYELDFLNNTKDE